MDPIGFPHPGAQVKRKADGLLGEVYASDPSKDLLTVRWSARSGHNTLVCTSEQFFRDWEATNRQKTNLTQPGKVLIVVFTAIALFAFMKACSSDTSMPSNPATSGVGSFTYPPSVLSHNISTADGNSELNATLKLQGWDGGEADMINITSDMRSIMEHELKEGGQEQSIDFHIEGDAGGGNDDYGRPIPSRLIGVFNIDFSMADIRQINWDHVYNFKLLNLAHVSAITAAGAEVGKKYCEKNREYSQAFCDNFQP